MSKAAELANLIGNINAGGGGVGRNLLINGAMNVAERSTSVTGLGATAGYFGLDRWKTDFSSTAGRVTLTQDSSVPTGEGFFNSLKVACTTADTSIAAGEQFTIEQMIEAQNCQVISKGTSGAKPLTLSFYCKANANATYVVELYGQDVDRRISSLFSVTTDWTRVTVTFPADTTGEIADDNGGGIKVSWWLHAGSNYSGGTLQTTWAAAADNTRATGGDSFFDSTSRTFFLTGCQLEVGQNPTEFEHEPFDVTLRKCNRYFEKVEVTAGSYAHIAYAYANDSVRAVLPYEKKRANPTFTFDNQGDVVLFYNGSDRDDNPNFNYHDAGPNSCRVSMDLTGVTTTAGYAVAAYVNGSVTYNIKVDAEL